MSDRSIELLLRAARLLPQPEQDELLLALVSGTALRRDADLEADPTPGTPGTPGAPGREAPPTDVAVRHWLDRALHARPIGARASLGVSFRPDDGDPALKVLPVRLPAGDYDRLRAFSREHGFSMAVIIRTLVERFLDGQARRWATPGEDLDDTGEETTAGHA